jgi:hypothetical protein
MMNLHQTRWWGRPLRPAPAFRGRTGWRRGPLAGLLAGGVAVTSVLGLALAARAAEAKASHGLDPAGAVSSARGHHPREKSYLKRHWGVEVMDVRETAAGFMLEFRYKVLDARKAKPLFERQTKPVLTHVESGKKLIVPVPGKTGALRNSNPPLAGRIYWMFFSNAGNLVKPGDHVSVEIGEFRADGLIVQ